MGYKDSPKKLLILCPDCKVALKVSGGEPRCYECDSFFDSELIKTIQEVACFHERIAVNREIKDFFHKFTK